jgi:tetratricopeptide (TPR) repeat protein
MILRLSTGAERAAVAVIAAVSFLFLSFFGVRDALAAYFASQDTVAGLSRATRFEPGNPDNWYALGRFWQYNLLNSDSLNAVAAYQKALSLNPQFTDAWLELAAAYESLGNVGEAGEAYRKAQQAYPLSAQVAWSYGNFLLRQGDSPNAFREIRRAVAADPHRGSEAFSRCVRVEPDVEKVLDQVIPPSRDVYLDIIDQLAHDDKTAEALHTWDRVVRLEPELRLRSVWELVGSLRRNHQIEEAVRVWKQAAAFAGFKDLGDPRGSVLWDGGFESGETALAYTWNFSPNYQGVQLRVQSEEKHSGSRALRITFDGRSNLSFRDVCHVFPVKPGTAYRFSAWVHSRDLSTDQGVHFLLSAFGGVDAAPLATSDMLGSLAWQEIAAQWTAPATASEAQVCLERLPSDQPDNQIHGTLWVDDVAVVPVPSGKDSP